MIKIGKQKISRLIAKMAYKTAVKSVGQASNWFEYQPKEPEKLKTQSEHKMNREKERYI